MSVRSSRRRIIAAVFTALIVCAAVAGGTSQARAQAMDVPLAPELTGLGTLHVPVTTLVPARSASSIRGCACCTPSITPRRSAPSAKPHGSIPDSRWRTGGRRWRSARTLTRR